MQSKSRGYSLTRELRPDLNTSPIVDKILSGQTVDSIYTHSIDGQLSIGWDPEKGEYISQTSIGQGYGAAKLSFKDIASGRKHDVNACINKTSAGDDFYINLNYQNSEFGQLYAKTYQERSIISALRELEVFGNDTSNSDNLLYEFIHPISSYLKYLTGSTSLESNDEELDIKQVVFDNLKNLPGLIRFDGFYDDVAEKHSNDPNNYYPVVNTIRLQIDASAFGGNLQDKFVLVLDFSEETCKDGVLFAVRFENINSLNVYGTFEVKIMDRDEKLSNYKINGLDINVTSEYNTNNKPFFDLSDLPLLVKVGIGTTNVYDKTYYATGTYSLSRSSRFQNLIDFLSWFDKSLNIEIPDFSNYRFTFALKVKDTGADGSKVKDVDACLRFDSNSSIHDSYDENERSESTGWFSRTYYKDEVSNSRAVSEFHLEGDDIYLKYYEIWKRQPKKRTSIFGSWSNNGSAKTFYKTHNFKTTRSVFIEDIMYFLPTYVLFDDDLGAQIKKLVDKFSSGDTPSLKFFEFFEIFGIGEGYMNSSNKGAYRSTVRNKIATVISGTIASIIGLNGYVNIGFDSANFANQVDMKFAFQLAALGDNYDLATFSLNVTNHKVLANNSYYNSARTELNNSAKFKQQSMPTVTAYNRRPGLTEKSSI